MIGAMLYADSNHICNGTQEMCAIMTFSSIRTGVQDPTRSRTHTYMHWGRDYIKGRGYKPTLRVSFKTHKLQL